MARTKRGVTSHARHKKIVDMAKGYVGRAGTNYRIAIEKVEKACNTPIATAAPRSAIFAVCGSSASMPACASTA